ncbi:nuclear pore complex protein Nup155 [Thalassophryne amazonica]|uniref:nuclear pore complex protein Nup155 n=1 Tax=Thalassophryne amazonica TaxID=390379 RepID=UPI001471E71C|nr:nuclear pore complex protein Nup155 [Thalassophryne amazonica]XP_034048070.1 nuclear pore complex protein Nup155 [Thalassophryne amazonica]XP_034048071.1 nuclear pore complex protein Nup155 [Thalassophryne amazonica]
MPSSAGASSPAAAYAEALENSAHLIDTHLHEDRCFPDLSELLSVPSHNMPTLSGVSDMDYPLQGPGLLSVPNLPELNAVRRVPLPPELVEQFSHMQCNCMMGVFPEICRAWLTIDNDIFMWNYEDGGDVAYFDGLIETILAVGLVKPKQGILQPHIHYLLVLATSVDVVILGLSFPKSQDGLNDSMCGGMQLLPDPLFSIPTDNTYIISITSTDLGRIFMAGKDGCLYEIVYQAEAGWLSQRCRKINHSKSTLSFLIPSLLQFAFSEDDSIVQITVDNSRNTLYTRSEKGVLQVYDLGADGQGMCRVATMSQNSIVAAAGNIARTIDRSVFKPIVQISVIDRSASSDCHLLAVTHAGVRLYFSTTTFAPQHQKHVAVRPTLLALVHVRLPPGFSASSTLQKPAKVHKALHSKGVLLMAASETEDSDVLWCINYDSFPFKKPLMETQMMSNVDGHSWALCVINEERPTKIITPLNKDQIPITDLPMVVHQHIIPPQKFVLLSAKGSHIFQKLRPVDQLRHLLVSCAGGESEEIERFFKLHREEQACATALILACSSAACDREVSQWATRAFFRYGGEAQVRFSAAITSPSNVGPMMSSPAPGILPPPLATPFAPMQSGSAPITPMPAGPEVVYSGKHNGICIYFARILGNIWDGSLVVEKTMNKGSQTVSILESSVASYDLELVLLELYGLREFLDKNSQFTPMSFSAASFSSPTNPQQRLLGFACLDGSSSQQVQQELQRKHHTNAQVHEKVSLQSIQQLVHRSYQTLALWKLLCDHQFSVIMSELPKDFQEQMKGASFKDVVIRGKEISGALITGLINIYIKDNASVDAISSHLRDISPLLYSSDDSVCSKANELLQSSRQIQNKTDKERKLRESLRLYQQISQHTDLPLVCSQYRQVRFYEGVLELCLTAADKKDPQRLGPHFYKNGEPEEDRVGQQAFQERLSCYKCLTDTMQEVVNQSKAAPQSPSVPKHPGPPVMTSDPNMLSNEEATAHFEQMLGLAQRSQDELFHIALYNWLIQADLTDKLLEISSPHLEEHLMHMIKQDQNKVHNMDLLWRYYEKNRNFGKAAQVLARLADMHSTEISLKQRLEYIARAILSAKSTSYISAQGADGGFLHELEERMDLVRIQVQIQETLIRQHSHHPSVKNAISQLDLELMDISKLYGEFADHHKLSECKLALIHCAGHSDPILVHSLWQEIMQKELADTIAMSPADRMRSLSLKLVSLGKIYAGTPRYFPLEFLVKFLEQEVCQLNWDVGFVTFTMQEIGVQLPRLLEVYDQLFKTRDPCWQRLKKPLHLVECIHVLLSGYVDDPSRVPTYDRRRFTNVCLDNICGYLVELQSLSPNAALQQTISNFKSLQSKLEKLH